MGLLTVSVFTAALMATSVYLASASLVMAFIAYCLSGMVVLLAVMLDAALELREAGELTPIAERA